MHGNTVIYTKGANTVKRQKLDKCIADGFRILDCSWNRYMDFADSHGW